MDAEHRFAARLELILIFFKMLNSANCFSGTLALDCLAGYFKIAYACTNNGNVVCLFFLRVTLSYSVFCRSLCILARAHLVLFIIDVLIFIIDCIRW